MPACMAIPWLYSVGFSITFGTLFAKIRRVYNMFMNAARAKGGVDIRKNAVTVQETVSVIGAVLLIDVFILVVWTVSSFVFVQIETVYLQHQSSHNCLSYSSLSCS